MAPPSLPRPLHHPSENRSPARTPVPPGPSQLPVSPRQTRSGDSADGTPASVRHPRRSPTHADRAPLVPDGENRSGRAHDDTGQPHAAPDSTDHPHPAPDSESRSHPSPDSAQRGYGGVHAADEPCPCADTADVPHRASDDTEDGPHPAPDTLTHPHRPPVPAGVLRPPGGGRLGRLPGPLGPDRLASGDPLPRSAAAFDLPAQPAAVGTARRVVRDLLTAWGVPDGTRDDAVLVTSELVTNALVHTAGGRIACRLHGTADRIRIEVEDQDGGPTLPTALRAGPDDQHGRGLLLVDALSRDWGVTPLTGRPAQVVWAELRSDHA